VSNGPTTGASGPAQRIGIYLSSQVLSALIALVQIGILGRALDRGGFGEFSFAFVVASLAALVADFGFGPWLTRQVAQVPESSRAQLAATLRARTGPLVAAWCLLVVTMPLHRDPGDGHLAIYLMMGYTTLQGYAMILESFLMGRHRATAVSGSLVAGKLVEFTAVAAWWWGGANGGATGAAGAHLAGMAFRVVLVAIFARRLADERWERPGRPVPRGLEILRAASPFAYGALLWTLYSRQDILVLERFVAAADLGLYAAAYRVLDALQLIPRSIVGVTNPLLAGLWGARPVSRADTAPGVRLLVLLGLGGAAALHALAPTLMASVFGPTFRDASTVLRWLAVVVPLTFLNQFGVMLLTATHRQALWIRLSIGAVVLNGVMNLLLVPRIGITGAAVSTVASESALFVAFAVATKGLVFSGVGGGWLARVLLTAAATWGTATLLPGGFWPRALAGGAVFLLGMLALRLFRIEDFSTDRGVRERAQLPPAEPSPPDLAAPNLSVVILTRNSEETLGAVLDAVRFAGDIVVVDDGSTDRTPGLAAAAGARLLSHPFRDFSDQRNFGARSALGAWILFLDSDEVPDVELRRAIASATSVGDEAAEGAAGYRVRMRNFFLGRPLRHGGMDEDRHLRLVRRGRSAWVGDVHERLIFDGPISDLTGVADHHTGRSIGQRLSKARSYARARARQWRREGRRGSPARMAWEPFRLFVGRVVVRQGWRDGWRGLLWWLLLSTEVFLAHAALFGGGEGAGGGPGATSAGRTPGEATRADDA
jgi:O-antigen/teichoic acid export membrane protein